MTLNFCLMWKLSKVCASCILHKGCSGQVVGRDTWFLSRVPLGLHVLTSATSLSPYPSWLAQSGDFSIMCTKVLVSWRWPCPEPHTPFQSLTFLSGSHSPSCSHTSKQEVPAVGLPHHRWLGHHFCEWIYLSLWWTDAVPTSLLTSLVLSSTTQRGNWEICGGSFLSSHNNWKHHYL